MEEVSEIKNIKKDLENAIKKSHEVTEKEATANFFKSVWQGFLRLFAPMM